MSFLFVDRILALNPGKETIGLKQVTAADRYVKPAENGKLALFPCVIGEALGQLCSWNVLKTSDFSFRPVGGVIKQIHMHADAYVNDTILLESVIETLDTENHIVSFSGHASVNGKKLISVENSLAPLLPLQEFNHLSQVHADFARLYQPGNDQLDIAHAEQVQPYHVKYDAVISHQPGEEIVAQKQVASSAPYFATHFPVKPVFPLSLLMEYNLHLAHSFLKEINQNLKAVSLRRVKIGNFILPGDTVTTKIKMKQCGDDECVLSIQNEVGDKKVCVAEVECKI